MPRQPVPTEARRAARWIALVLVTMIVASAAADPAPASRRRSDAPASVSALLTPRGVWLGSGPRPRCFVTRSSGTLDSAALETELRRLHGDDRSSIAIAAIRGVTYQELIATMDVAAKVGLLDAAIDSAEALGAAFDDTPAGRASAPAHCSPPLEVQSTPGAPPARPGAPLRQLTRSPSPAELERRRQLLAHPVPLPPAPRPDYTHTPVVIVTTSDITLRGQLISPVAGVADGHGAIPSLLTALEQLARDTPAAAPTTAPRQLILQADAALDAVVIERVLLSARAAGYPDLLFAVRQPARP